jgi:hypothetical protein
MSDEMAEPIVIEAAGWRVLVCRQPPWVLDYYGDQAECVERLVRSDEDGYVFVGVERPHDEWPNLMISQTFAPAVGGFSPGVLVVPETQRVFVGAGTRLLCYRTDDGRWVRQRQDDAEIGFWGWRLHGEVVVMSAELELAAWTTAGEKLWTTFVEPPWSYSVEGSTVRLDVMGEISEFPLRTGR